MGDGSWRVRVARLGTAGVTAPFPTWPADQPLAVCLNVMLEGWAEGSAPGIGPMGNPLKPGVRDLQALSWAEYGPKVGAWRLLDLLDRAGRKAVFYTSGVVAERYPELPAAIGARGHAVAAHAWSQGTPPLYLSPDAEWADIVRCREVLTATAGARPLGWLSPRCTPSNETARFLARAGFQWHADMFDSDVPYRIDTGEGMLVGMPFTMEVNDMPLYVTVWQRTGGVHPHPGADRQGLGAAGQSICLPRHHCACACVRAAIWCDRVPGRARICC